MKKATTKESKVTLDELIKALAKVTAKVKIPKTVAGMADLRYTVREQRKAIEKCAELLKKVQTELDEYFIANLPKSDASGVAGQVARIQLGRKIIPQVADWDAFYKHVQDTGEFELLQRRLNEGAMRERLEAKVLVPGTTTFTAVTVSCTKL